MANNLGVIKRYFGKNGWDYGHPEFVINENLDLAYYYWSLIPKAHFQGPRDNNGVILSGNESRRYYSVIDIAQYAMGNYELYLNTHNQKYLKVFLANCDWLEENQISKIGSNLNGVWLLPYEVPLYNIKAGWVSALGQGLAISALTRAYQCTGEDHYLDTALRGVEVFKLDKAAGGVKTEEDGFICYEEYQSKTPSCVLNGHISALWGLYDLNQVSDDNTCKEMFEDAISSLEENIVRYDIGYWTRYDLYSDFKNVASYFYHDLHIKQLKILYLLTNLDIFNVYSERWFTFQQGFYNRTRAFLDKIYFTFRFR